MKLFVTFLLLASQSFVLGQKTCADIEASCHKQLMCCVDLVRLFYMDEWRRNLYP